MSTLQINKGKLPSVVEVPPSKSYANRALILAALKPSPVTIKNLTEATDVTFLKDALIKVGLRITDENHNLTIHNSFPQCETSDLTIEVGEGGTTARFLAAFLLLGKKRYTLKLGRRLKDRPWSEFISTVVTLGGYADLSNDELTLQGPIKEPAILEADCTRTTQFATAFDLTLKKTKVIPLNLKTSQSYWDMNKPLKDHLVENNSYDVPLDWSSAAYPMVFAALNHGISFPGLFPDVFQADSKLADVLKKIGTLELQPTGMEVRPASSNISLSMDMSDCLDLFPAMSFLVAHIPGVHVLSGLQNLVHKESDRLNEIMRLLSTFNRKHSLKEDILTIYGDNQGCGEKYLELPDDHRIVMTGALFLRHHQGGTLSHPSSVSKSYPGFFDLMK